MLSKEQKIEEIIKSLTEREKYYMLTNYIYMIPDEKIEIIYNMKDMH